MAVKPAPPGRLRAEVDTAGVTFFPAKGTFARTYDSSNNLLTESITIGGLVRTKTFTYANGNCTAETGWVPA